MQPFHGGDIFCNSGAVFPAMLYRESGPSGYLHPFHIVTYMYGYCYYFLYYFIPVFFCSCSTAQGRLDTWKENLAQQKMSSDKSEKSAVSYFEVTLFYRVGDACRTSQLGSKTITFH